MSGNKTVVLSESDQIKIMGALISDIESTRQVLKNPSLAGHSSLEVIQEVLDDTIALHAYLVENGFPEPRPID